MTEIENILEAARSFAVQHAPAEVLRGALPAAVVMLVAGIGISVLGAKLARFGMTTGFVVVGGALGAAFSKEFNFAPIICVLGGALLVGVIGFQTFRVWVGLGAALVFSSLVMGTFGYQKVVPYMSEFRQQMDTPRIESPLAFALPSKEEQAAYRERTPKQWVEEFWTYLTQRDSATAQNTKALALVALLTGLCMGILAVRWALIIATSLVGTVLVTSAMATLLTNSVPESCQAFQRNPSLVGVGVGGFLVTSLILQTMLSRKSPAAAESGNKN